MKSKDQTVFTHFANNITQYFSGDATAYLDVYKTPDNIDGKSYIDIKLGPIVRGEETSAAGKIGLFSRLFDRMVYNQDLAAKEYDQVFSMATYKEQLEYMNIKMAHAAHEFIDSESTPPRLRKHFIDAINHAYPPTIPTTYEKLVESMFNGDETKFAQMFTSNVMVAYYDAMLSNENNKRLETGMITVDELIQRSRLTLASFDIIAHSFFNSDNNIDKFILKASDNNELVQLIGYIKYIYEKLLLMDEGLDLRLRNQLIELNRVRDDIADYLSKGDMTAREVQECRSFIQDCRELLQSPGFDDTLNTAVANFSRLSVCSEEKKNRLNAAVIKLEELDLLLSELHPLPYDPDLILLKTLKKSAKDLLAISDQKLTADNNIKIQNLFSAMHRFDEESFTQRLNDAKKMKSIKALSLANEVHNELNDKRLLLEQYMETLSSSSNTKKMEAVDSALRELSILSRELGDALVDQQHENIEELVFKVKEYLKIIEPIISPPSSPATSRSSSFSSITSALSRRSPSPKNEELLQQTNNDMILLYNYRKGFTQGTREFEYISLAINELQAKQNAIRGGLEVHDADLLTHLTLCARAYELLRKNKELSKDHELTEKYDLVYNTLKKYFMTPFVLENHELERIIEIIQKANNPDVDNMERTIIRASDLMFKKVTTKVEEMLTEWRDTEEQIQDLSFLRRIHNPILDSNEIDELLECLSMINDLISESERGQEFDQSAFDSHRTRIEGLCHYNSANDPMSRHYKPDQETPRNSF